MKRVLHSASAHAISMTALGLAFFVGSASASRTELESRGLPRFLAVDSYNLSLLPATATELAPQIQADFGEFQEDNALGMAGASWRFAYQLEADMHHLVLATPGGLGFVLAYRGVSDTRRSQSESSRQNLTDEFALEERDLELGLGFGWRKRSQAGRVSEIALRGSYLGGGTTSRRMTGIPGSIDSQEETLLDVSGFGVDLILRSLAPAKGWSGAVRFVYRDPQAEVNLFVETPGITLFAGLDVGYRLQPGSVDDVVLGLTGSWLDESIRGRAGVGAREQDLETLLFVSIEEYLLDSLPIRAGLRGGVAYSRDESTEPGPLGVQFPGESRTESWNLTSAEVRAGLGWLYKNLTLDAWLRTDIRLDRPVVTWAATFQFE